MHIRVLIADDSPTARMLLRAILESDPMLRVIAEATNGEEAVEMTEELKPDVVVMDVHMPKLDGLEATTEIMARSPTPIVVCSAVNRRDVDLSLSATQAGALIALSKPESPASPRFAEQRDQLIAMTRAMAGVKVVRRWSPERRAQKVRAPRRSASGRVELIAVAASTGGPAALRRMLDVLPRDFPVPILLVQHIARDFTGGFAEWLASGTTLDVHVARDGEKLLPGTVYVAPDDRHLGLADGRIRISASAPVGGFRPAASFLFDSVATACGDAAVGVILTGMGSDGADGLDRLHRAGGYVIGQDEDTSIVFGMAREAWLRGAVDALLPLDRISEKLIELVHRGRNGE